MRIASIDWDTAALKFGGPGTSFQLTPAAFAEISAVLGDDFVAELERRGVQVVVSDDTSSGVVVCMHPSQSFPGMHLGFCCTCKAPIAWSEDSVPIKFKVCYTCGQKIQKLTKSHAN